MTRIVLLNNVDHGDLRVSTARGAQWGEAVNRVPVFPLKAAKKTTSWSK